MSSSSSSTARRAWMVATSIAAVEALKDQGICRWNYTLRSVNQHVKNNLKSVSSHSNNKKLSSSSSSSSSSTAAMVSTSKVAKRDQQKIKQSEESLRTVMYLSCWGPN